MVQQIAPLGNYPPVSHYTAVYTTRQAVSLCLGVYKPLNVYCFAIPLNSSTQQVLASYTTV